MRDPAPTQLVVFSDDWGRHPSSCQHLVRHLLPPNPDLEVLWVNTIGTRSVRLSWKDAKKIARKLSDMLRGSDAESEAIDIPDRLTVLSPKMYPGFRSGWQRRFNTKQMQACVNAALKPGCRHIALTTLPITADLVEGMYALDVDRWVYYCVDDFSVWPGSDGTVMDTMERDLAPRVNACLAVSETLHERLTGMHATWAHPGGLLTHGIDLQHWTAPNPSPGGLRLDLPEPVVLFWGLIDTRLDSEWVTALAMRLQVTGGSLVLVGPTQEPDPKLLTTPGIQWPGPADYADLPALAAKADVLVMPYADLPVTRAMQPLKFKEYLATGKPVVARNLPAVREWADAADLVSDAESFVQRVAQRVESGLPDDQANARKRLADESWDAKAEELAKNLGFSV